jgi:hypothetical protein
VLRDSVNVFQAWIPYQLRIVASNGKAVALTAHTIIAGIMFNQFIASSHRLGNWPLDWQPNSRRDFLANQLEHLSHCCEH